MGFTNKDFYKKLFIQYFTFNSEADLVKFNNHHLLFKSQAERINFFTPAYTIQFVVYLDHNKSGVRGHSFFRPSTIPYHNESLPQPLDCTHLISLNCWRCIDLLEFIQWRGLLHREFWGFSNLWVKFLHLPTWIVNLLFWHWEPRHWARENSIPQSILSIHRKFVHVLMWSRFILLNSSAAYWSICLNRVCEKAMRWAAIMSFKWHGSKLGDHHVMCCFTH